MATLPYQPVPLVAEVKATYRQGTNLMSNVFHVAKDTEWSGADLDQLLQIYYDWDNLEGKQERAASIELTHLTGAALVSQDAPYRARSVDPAVGGIHASQALPINCTLAVTAVTGTRGRGRQGRCFWIGLAEDMVDENVVTNTSKTNIVDDMNALLTAFNTPLGWEMCIVHRFRAGERLAEGTFTPIQVFTVRDTTIDTQDLRLPGHRRHKKKAAVVPAP